MTTRKNIRLASFDGGGVRGLSQLEIMNSIVHRLNWNEQSNASEPLLPCEHFDLIGGSGTGGLIAIMFAKLRMTVEEACEEFCAIAEVYNQTDITPKDRTQHLRTHLEGIMERKQLPIDMKLLDGSQVRDCACFVVTSPRVNAGSRICLRSYPVKNHPASSATVIEAALATCVTQPIFSSISIGANYKKKDYIGVGIGGNNPINEVIAEAHSLFGGESTVVSLLSIGNGHPGIITLPSDGSEVNLHGAMRDIMNDCTERAREIKQRIGRAGIYYRFSVEQGMQDDQPSQAMDPEWIVTQTESYMEEQMDQLEAFAKNNNTQINVATLEQLKFSNVQTMLPANLDMMNVSNTGPNNEVVILTKLRALDLDCGPAVGQCMEGTRQDILTTVLDWALDLDAPNIFWVKGHPGVGKSAISVTLTDGLRKSKQLGSSFFFQRERANALTPNTLWRVVAYDLARKYPMIRRQMLVALTANEALITTLNTEMLFRELVYEPLTTCGDLSNQNPPIIVIDALDECGGLDGQRSEHRANLRHTLKHWSNLPRLFKLIVTSRGEADLEELFSTTDHFPLEIHAGTVASPNSLEDIKKFFEYQFRQIINRYQNELSADWPGHQIIQELTLRSGGLFIWAKTIIRFLNQGDPEEQLSRILDGTGAGGMATLYSWILRAAFPQPSERVTKAFHAFVGTVILAKEPLPAASILELCSISPPTAKYIRSGLQSVMTSGDIPRFKHQSVVDFLIDPTQCPSVFLIDQNDQNRRLTLQCLQTMKKQLRFNICGIESSYYRNSDIPDLTLTIEERISRHLLYSCCFWTGHLIETCFDAGIHEKICDFMENQFLFWMEVLSLIKCCNRGSGMIQLLINWLQSAGQDGEMAVDMKKFISMFGTVISQSAPHIYLSALPFSPQRSLVSRQYKKNYPGILYIRSGGQSGWPAIQNVLIGHTDSVYSVAFSPDGKRLASGSWDETIRVWDVETGDVVAGPFEGHTSHIQSVAFSPDGKRIVSGSWDNTIRIWDTETGEVVASPFEGHTAAVKSVIFSLDGKRVVSGSWDNTIRVWDAQTGGVLAGPFEGHTDSVDSIAFSPDERRIVSGSWDKTIRVWDVTTGETVAGPFVGHTNRVNSVAFSPDGECVLSGSSDNTIRVWGAEAGNVVVGPFEGHTESVNSVAFSPDGKRIVSGSSDMTILVWDAKTGEIIGGPFEGHISFVDSVVFSPDGKRVVSGSDDMTIRVWDIETGEVVANSFDGHTSSVKSVAFSPDGKHVISGAGDKTIRIWDAETGEVIAGPFEGHTDSVNSVAFSPEGNRAVSGSWDHTILVWDTETGEVIAGPFKDHTYRIGSVIFSPDGKRVVSGSWDNTIRVWDVETNGAAAEPFKGHTEFVTSVAFSSDGKRIVSGSWDNTVRLWDVETGELVAGPFEGHTDTVNSVAFSPDGKRVVSGSWDDAIRVWDTETGEVVVGPLEDHTNRVHSVAFSPDGKRIISGSWDNTIRLWDVETGKVVADPFEGHTSYVYSVAFSPDGERIVSASDDRTVRIWDAKDSVSGSPPFTDGLKMPDGWFLGSNSELLFWVPPELRTGLYWHRNTLIIGRCIKTKLDFRHFVHGKEWSQCKDPLPEEISR